MDGHTDYSRLSLGQIDSQASSLELIQHWTEKLSKNAVDGVRSVAVSGVFEYAPTVPRNTPPTLVRDGLCPTRLKMN
jgi:hypothetical protein